MSRQLKITARLLHHINSRKCSIVIFYITIKAYNHDFNQCQQMKGTKKKKNQSYNNNYSLPFPSHTRLLNFQVFKIPSSSNWKINQNRWYSRLHLYWLYQAWPRGPVPYAFTADLRYIFLPNAITELPEIPHK